jgi:hypothetical protein
MKYLIGLLLFASTASATTYTNLVRAIHMVESGGQINAKDGDNGRAIGPFQIHKSYWADATTYDKTIGGRYEDCRNYDYALKIVNAYLHRYGKRFIEAENWQALARIHNGGPNGWKIKATLRYWERVKRHMD